MASQWILFGDASAQTERNLAPDEVLRVDTGCVVAYTPNVDFDIQFVGNIKTTLFGGEGLFFAGYTRASTKYIQHCIEGGSIGACGSFVPRIESEPKRRILLQPFNEYTGVFQKLRTLCFGYVFVPDGVKHS